MNDVSPSKLPFDWQCLDRFFAGDCSAEERDRVLQWASGYPSRSALLRDLQALGEPGHAVASIITARAWDELMARLTEPPQESKRVDGAGGQPDRTALRKSAGFFLRPAWGGSFKGQPLRQRMWTGIVTVVASTLILVVAWMTMTSPLGQHHHPAMERYTTANGQRATVTLADGSTVLLNVSSRLEVPVDYATGDHTVRLSGEALFTIVQHKARPFTILAGQTTTRVLGTTFIVRHYPTDAATTIAVREGRVAVGPSVVTTNQVIAVRPNETPVRQLASPSTFSFVTGILTLDALKVSDAIPELDRWYDADIRLGTPTVASQGIVDGRFAAGSLADLATNLEMALDVRVVREGRVLTLYPKR